MNRYDLIILGLLEQKPCHGYDIKMFVETNHLNNWANINVSSLYNRLGWLSKNGFINGTEEQVGNRPMRTSYEITHTGKQLLHEEIKEFVSGFNDDPRTLGLSFLHALPATLAKNTLKDHITYLENEVDRQKGIIKEKRKNSPMLHPMSPILSQMSLEHIQVELKYMRAVLDILDDAKLRRKLKTIFDINT